MDTVISTKLNTNDKTKNLKIVLYEVITHGEPHELILEKSQELDISSFNEINSISID